MKKILSVGSVALLVIGFFAFAPQAFAAAGSGTNAVSPTSTLTNTTGKGFKFTFTAAETMDSGEVDIDIPSAWSNPTSTSGRAGYTTATSTDGGMIANVINNMDSVTGWNKGKCYSIIASTTVKHEGTASIECVKFTQGSNNNKWYYRPSSAVNWSAYTKVSFWINLSTSTPSGDFNFAFSSSTNLSSPQLISINTAIPANTWTYITLDLSSTTRSRISSYGFQQKNASDSTLKNANIFIDDLLAGPGSLTFPNGTIVDARILQLASGQTLTFAYGDGGGASGVTAPVTAQTNTATTTDMVSDAGTLTAIATQPTLTALNPTPTTTSISPTSTVAGGSQFTLTANGTNFVASSTINWNGSGRATTFVSSTRLTATVPAADIASVGTASITVVNPSPGGGTSNAQTFTVNPVNTTTTVTSSATSSVYGNSVTFTATVTPASGGAPTGTVTFWDETSTLGTASLNGANPGVATFATSSLTVTGSPHSITAVYNAAGIFAGSTSTAISQIITPKPLTVTGITAQDKVYDASTTATLLGTPGSLVGVISPDSVSLTGTAVGTFATTSVGTGITVTISGQSLTGAQSPNYSLTEPTTTASITQKPLTITGITANDKIYDGTTSATLNTGSAALVGVISGDTVTLNTTNASGTFATSSVGTGILVTISGLTIGGASSPNYSLTQPTTTASILNPVPTTTAISPTSTSAGGSSFTLTVTGTNFVASSTVDWNGSPLATTFTSSTQLSATVPAGDIVSPGTATVTVVNPTPGGGTSNGQTFTITLISTVTNVVSSATSSVYGNSVTFTATVTPASGGAPTGTVTFKDGASPIGASSLNGANPGVATLSTSTLSVSGSPHSITAVYGGNGTLAGSTSTPISQTIAQATSSVTVTCPSSVTYTGSPQTPCIASYTTSDNLSGSLTVNYANNTNAGTATASSTYSGDSNHAPSSNSATFTINNPVPTTTSISPTSTTAGGSSFVLTVNGTNFVPSSTVSFNGINATTTYVSATQLTAQIPASDVTTAGTYPVAVTNAAPGGGTSNTQTFTVFSATSQIVILAPGPATVDAPLAVTVQAEKADNSIDASFNGRVTLNVSGPAPGGGVVTITSGVGTTTVSDTVAESVTLSLTNPSPAGLNVSSTQTVVFSPGVVREFVLQSSSSSVTFGTRAPFVVSRTDQYNNAVSSGTTAAYLFANSTSTNSQFFATATLGSPITSTAISGGTTSTNFWYTNDPGTWTVTVSDNPSGPTSTGAIASASATTTITVVPTRLVIAPSSVTSTAGTTVSVSVQAQDDSGNIATTFNGSATLVVATTSSATGGGVVTITNGTGTSTVHDTVAETVALSLRDTGSTGLNVSSTGSIQFFPGPVAKFALDHPGNMNAGARNGYTVSREDQYNNPVSSSASSTIAYLWSNSTGTPEFWDSASGGNQITSTTIPFNATSSDFWYYDTAPGTWTVTVSDNPSGPTSTGAIASASDTFSVTTGAVKFVFANVTSTATAGDTATLNVEAVDSFNNIDATFNQDVTVTKTGSATGGGLVTIVNGIGTSTVRDTVAETVTLGLSDTQGTGLNVSSTAAITFEPGPLAKFALNHPGNMNTGTRLGFTLAREDQYGNFVTASNTVAYLYTSSTSTSAALFDAASGGSQITSTTIFTGATSTMFWYYDTVAGTVTVTASNNPTSPGGLSGVTDGTDTFSVAPGAVKFVFANVPSSATTGNVATFNIHAVDSFGAIDPTFNRGVTVTKTGSATGGGPVTLVSGVGTTTITDLVGERVTLGLSDTQSTGLGVIDTASMTFVAPPPPPPTPPAPTPSAGVPPPSPTQDSLPPTTNLTFSGWAYPKATISFIRKDQGISEPAVTQPVVPAADGSFSVTVSNVLRIGGQTYVLSFADPVGRMSHTKVYDVAELNAKYGITLVSVNGVSTPTFSAPNILIAPTLGFTNVGVISKNAPLGITGYATPKSTVTVMIDGAVINKILVTDPTGKYQDILTTDNLAVGRHSISAFDTFNGTQSDTSDQLSFTISPLVNPRLDLNGDGVIDIKDLSIFLTYLQNIGANLTNFSTTNPDLVRALDFVGDGVVDLKDLSIMLEAIGLQAVPQATP